MLLVIDNYDSFTYNLVQYLGELGETLEVRRNNRVTIAEIENELRPERIVISPGPGTPDGAGITLDVIEHTEQTIHRVVRRRQPGALPPRLRTVRVGPKMVILTYDSPRRLCAVARGIARGVAARFAEALTSGKLVTRATYELMTTPKPDVSSPRYGYGFQLDPPSGIAGHSGGFPGISSNLDIFKGTGYVAVVLSNYGAAGQPVVDKIRALVRARTRPADG